MIEGSPTQQTIPAEARTGVHFVPKLQPTLTKTLQGVELTDNERRAVVAADALPNSLAAKRILVAAHVLFTAPSGVVRASEVLGFTHDQTVHARDMVKTVPIYTTLWQRHQALMQPGAAEIAIYKRVKMSHAKIAEKIQVDKSEVDRISRNLADLGIIRRHAPVTDQFEQLCREVEIADKQAGDSPLPTGELAAVMDADYQRVSRARRRNRLQAKASSLGRTETTAVVSEIKRALIVHHRRSNAAIAEQLGKKETQVANQRERLLVSSVLQRRVSLSPSDKEKRGIPSLVEEAKQRLGEILDGILANDSNPIVLAHLREDNPCLQKVSITTIKVLYHELAGEGDVPPLLRPR
jgi:DNA-binding Lrp family transcriptional regulator